MKKIAIIALVGVLAFTVFMVSSCDSLSEKQTECLANIQKGLQSRWDVESVRTTTFAEKKQRTIEGIQAELDAVSSCVPDGGNSKFNDIFNEYVASLESERDAAQALYSCSSEDVKVYNEQYVDNGHVKRAQCLNALSESYGLIVDEEYKGDFDSARNPDSFVHAVSTDQFVTLENEHGAIEVATRPLDRDSWYTHGKHMISDTQIMTVVRCTVNNVSYSDHTDPGHVDLMDFIELQTPTGFMPGFENHIEDWKYPGYETANKGYATMAIGETKNIACGSRMENDTDIVAIYFSDDDSRYVYYAPVE